MFDSIKSRIFAKKPYACEVVEKLAELFTAVRMSHMIFWGFVLRIVQDDKMEWITEMIKPMPYEEYRNLSYDERREVRKEELENIGAVKDYFISQKDSLLNQKVDLLNQIEKENLRLRKLVYENFISL